MFCHLMSQVASFTDAWIETAVMARLKDAGLSHLLQMRGLKRISSTLKKRLHSVASFTDAWIETPYQRRHNQKHRVASFTDAWIETDMP